RYAHAMDPVTPAMLALEAGVSQRRVRHILRDLYGTLPQDTTRWALEAFQADEVRQRLRNVQGSEAEWSLEIGDTVRRRLLHRQSEEHTSELQSRENLVCRLLLENKK